MFNKVIIHSGCNSAAVTVGVHAVLKACIDTRCFVTLLALLAVACQTRTTRSPLVTSASVSSGINHSTTNMVSYTPFVATQVRLSTTEFLICTV